MLPYICVMNNEGTTPAAMNSFKISTISTETGCTFDGRTFTTASDLCDDERNLLTFSDLYTAEVYATKYAKARGLKYLEIGDASEPAVGETFVEVRTA